jgi:hypothetical protein
MKTWGVYAVEAESEAEAIEKGWHHDNCYASACHQCSEHFEDPEVTDLTVEEEKP